MISDLKIGEPGDGFTVVSAMRRTQPRCITIILTGYPGFTSALEAIQRQVDEYFVKPAKPQTLLSMFEDRLHAPKSSTRMWDVRTIAQVLGENRDLIVQR